MKPLLHQHNRRWSLFPLSLVSLLACSPAEAPPSLSEDEPTQEPGPDLRKTTWGANIREELDPLVQADTVLFFNVETQENGQVTGWIWHTWGYLIIGGYEVPEREVVALEGTYTWERHLRMTGFLFGHTASIDAEIWEEGFVAEVVLTIDEDAYDWYSHFTHRDYVAVHPK